MMSGLVLFCVVFSSFLMVAALLYNARAIAETLQGVGGRAWPGLFVIFVLALALRLHPAHRHIIFMDEPALMEAGKSILVTHTAGGYSKCITLPYVISILFALFGISNQVVLYANSVFGALTVAPVFLAAHQLFNKRVVARAIQINGVSYRTNVSIENNTIALKPECFDEFLEAHTQYTFLLTGALRSTQGVALTPAELVFHTSDEINPQGPPRGCAD